jgi:hypothetical protein
MEVDTGFPIYNLTGNKDYDGHISPGTSVGVREPTGPEPGNNSGAGAIQRRWCMEQRVLDIFLQAQALISEREGMIAENKQREHLDQSMAFTEDSFLQNASLFGHLLEILRS